MITQFELAVGVMGLCGVIALSSLIKRQAGARSWVLANLIVVVVGAAALAFIPSWAGAVALSVALPLIVAPAVLSALIVKFSNRGRFDVAARLARVACVLHPSEPWRDANRVLTARAEAERSGDRTALDAWVADAPAHTAVLMRADAAAEVGDWASALEIIRHAHPVHDDGLPMELRALGALGQIDEMALLYDTVEPRLKGVARLNTQLFLLVYSGRVEAVRKMLARSFLDLDGESRRFWIALAALRGDPTNLEARARLTLIAETAVRPRTRASAALHLAAAPVPQVASEKPETNAIIDGLAAVIIADVWPQPRGLRAYPVTVALLVLNGIGYAAELYTGQPTSNKTLFDLGALWPPVIILGGEWWRLVSATLLHAGALHLTANLYGLFAIGRLLEAGIGAWRTLVIYWIGAVGSSGAVLGFMWYGWTERAVYVGASGAILACFGAVIAFTLKTRTTATTADFRKRLILFASAVVIQFGLDLVVPEISMTAHLSGLLIGFVLGLILIPTPAKPV